MKKITTDRAGSGTNSSNRDKQTLVLFVLGCFMVGLPFLVQHAESPPKHQYTWAPQDDNSAWQVVSTRYCLVVQDRAADSTLVHQQKINGQEKIPPAFALFFNQPLPVNTCQEQDLKMLPGIGPRLAAAIVTTRSTKGRFTGPEDLLEVPGIGPIILQRLSPFISFE
ncbi:MAG: helix-hairpin-helix domain-containing protein [Desulfobulbus oligotrophicus]|jgi:competence protein ComEA|nr:helix-hairpin-helix domain-containing protein [Desulfobulbus oligotrophicus]